MNVFEDFSVENMKTALDITDALNGMSRPMFLATICKAFDNYDATHPDFDPVSESAVVAAMVQQTNEAFGRLGVEEDENGQDQMHR